jgi:hypothetical protein
MTGEYLTKVAEAAVIVKTIQEVYVVTATGDAPVLLLQFINHETQKELQTQYEPTGYKAVRLELEIRTDRDLEHIGWPAVMTEAEKAVKNAKPRGFSEEWFKLHPEDRNYNPIDVRDAIEQIDMIDVGGLEESIFVYADGSSFIITEENEIVLLTEAELAAKRERFAELAAPLEESFRAAAANWKSPQRP